MISDNRQGGEHPGAIKHGDALLAGILRCRRCGQKLTLRYTGSRHDIPRYSCSRGWMDNGEPRCIAFGGLRVDDAIAAEILRVVEPAAVEAAKQAQRQTLKDRDDVCDALTRDLEAARFAADRAFRQYDAADPDNRLVAAELELRWNRALKRVTDLQQRIDDHERQRPAPTSTIPEDFTSLARDLPAVWADPATDARLKKRLVRTLLQEVIADIEAQASEIVLVLHWVGGVHTELRLPRRRRGQRNSTAVEIIEAVRMLVRRAIKTALGRTRSARIRDQNSRPQQSQFFRKVPWAGRAPPDVSTCFHRRSSDRARCPALRSKDPRRPPRLPQRGEKNMRVVRIERNVNPSRVLVLVKNFFQLLPPSVVRKIPRSVFGPKGWPTPPQTPHPHSWDRQPPCRSPASHAGPRCSRSCRRRPTCKFRRHARCCREYTPRPYRRKSRSDPKAQPPGCQSKKPSACRKPRSRSSHRRWISIHLRRSSQNSRSSDRRQTPAAVSDRPPRNGPTSRYFMPLNCGSSFLSASAEEAFCVSVADPAGFLLV